MTAKSWAALTVPSTSSPPAVADVSLEIDASFLAPTEQEAAGDWGHAARSPCSAVGSSGGKHPPLSCSADLAGTRLAGVVVLVEEAVGVRVEEVGM